MATSLRTSVASWRPPAWATATARLDAGIVHSRPCPVDGLFVGPHGSARLEVRLLQQDDIDIDGEGEVRVLRPAAVIAVEEHQLTLAGAALLRDVLTELLDLAADAQFEMK